MNGPLLVAKCKILEEKFDVPAEKHLKGKGWLPNFYKVYVSQTYCTVGMLLTIVSSYGLKENRQHGEAASANPEDITCEGANLKEINACYKLEDQFNGDESYINPFNPPD